MNIKHEVENLITDFDRLQEAIIDLGKHLIHRSNWIIGAQEQIRGLKERVEALEKAHYRLEPVPPPVTDPTPPPAANSCTVEDLIAIDHERVLGYAPLKDTDRSDVSSPVHNPPSVPSEEDLRCVLSHRGNNYESFRSVIDYSRHCAKHHVLSAKEREACKNWLMEWYGVSNDNLNTQYATMRAFIERLLTTLPVEDGS